MTATGTLFSSARLLSAEQQRSSRYAAGDTTRFTTTNRTNPAQKSHVLVRRFQRHGERAFDCHHSVQVVAPYQYTDKRYTETH